MKRYLFLMLLSLPAFPMPDPALWERGITELKENHAKEAIESLSRWILEAESTGFKSAEAHYNLGIAHWGAQDAEHSMTELLKAAELRHFPWQSWNDFDSMGLIQREIGLTDNPADSLHVRSGAVFSRNAFLFIFFTGLWSLCLYAVLRTKSAGRAFGPLLLLLSTSCGLGLLGLTVAMKTSGVLRVVAKVDGGAFLVPIPQEMESSEALMELPAGSLLLTDSASGEFLHVKSPVPGWIHKDSLSTG